VSVSEVGSGFLVYNLHINLVYKSNTVSERTDLQRRRSVQSGSIQLIVATNRSIFILSDVFILSVDHIKLRGEVCLQDITLVSCRESSQGQ